MRSEELIRFAAGCYGVDGAAFLTGGREDAKRIYTFRKGGRTFVLRLVKCPSGRLAQTKAELEWLSYLARAGLGVPSPLRTNGGELAVTALEDGTPVILSAFSLLEGKSWNKESPDRWNQTVFYQWGRAVGDLHRLSKDYAPGAVRRDEFQLRSMIGEGLGAFPAVGRIAEALLDEIEALPRDRDSFGLIHNDLHPGNFLIDGDHINLFDFDGCAYSWYAFDIGSALFLALWLGRRNSAGTEFTSDIIRCFLKGYLSVNALSGFWLSKIPLFLRICKIALFSLGCDCENPETESCAERRREQAHGIETDVLFADCAVEAALFQRPAPGGIG